MVRGCSGTEARAAAAGALPRAVVPDRGARSIRIHYQYQDQARRGHRGRHGAVRQRREAIPPPVPQAVHRHCVQPLSHIRCTPDFTAVRACAHDMVYGLKPQGRVDAEELHILTSNIHLGVLPQVRH